MRSRFIDELKDELGIEDIKARYSGDYGDDDDLDGYHGYRNRYSGYGGYTKNGDFGYGNSAPKRVGRANQNTDDGYRSFGGVSKSQKRDTPVRFGNVGGGATVTKQIADGTAKGKDVSQFTVGVKVRHPRFGDGIITATRGSANNLIVTVKFEVAGNKDLAAALAPIEIIS